MNADTPISDLGRYGKALAGRFRRLEIRNVGELLLHPPLRYEDLSEVKSISELRPGETATVRATVEAIASRRSPQKRMPITEAVLADETGKIAAVWFNQPYIASSLKPGTKASFAGKVANDYGRVQMVSPIYEAGERSVHTGRVIPIYPTTANLTQKHIRSAVEMAMPALASMADPLPKEMAEKLGLVPFAAAVREIHYPSSSEKLASARRRLQFDELILHQLLALRIKDDVRKEPAVPIPFSEEEIKRFVASLPFALTADQKKAAWAILKDMEKGEPMHRLLDGDVGSGKTAVAAIAAVNVAAAGEQAAIMAPTEVLAKQHYETLSKFLGREKLALRTGAYEEGSADAPLVVGTHALIEESLPLPRLALAVIDEQHRFGVEQRAALMRKRADGRLPHLLTMTATPIPRTLHLALYGDLDISLLKEKPLNRLPIITKVLPHGKYAEAYEKIRSEVASGRQAFVVCPLIDPSDALGIKSATEIFNDLSKNVFPELEVGLLHGRLKSAEKERIMAETAEGKIQVLVSTAVIEVGIDVPNATVMAITGAERFGLAQLHQFRGRVGRSDKQSFCYALAGENGVSARLKAFASCTDGFELAEKDLALRGPGELFGTRQSGIEEMKFATFNDLGLVEEARAAAQELLACDPSLETVPLLREKVLRHERASHLE